ncbi:DinB family protein [Solitalea koreensis]|uniref:DinB superfamily protein n=1 Tax=Solitalea koreensis TaxID=543615 RepID=A0A521BZQ8_9SPHI|nr:DinB family protein [Solitalea koreensis]SMO52689.1 DinB superfamily protein [Solitalea koreensis]
MTHSTTKGAVNALLGEYERAISELRQTISDISEAELNTIVDNTTLDPNCKSIQTILAHVVRAAYSYAIYIQKLKGSDMERPSLLFRKTIGEFQQDLNDAFYFTTEVFKNINDGDLEEFDDSKKILSPWGQRYDIEQMMEHAIVHILRHRRQINKFKQLLRKQSHE